LGFWGRFGHGVECGMVYRGVGDGMVGGLRMSLGDASFEHRSIRCAVLTIDFALFVCPTWPFELHVKHG
jgi:hypothetical protein